MAEETNWHLAKGYRYGGLHCGIRPDPNRRDLAMILSDPLAAAAGVFTQNSLCGAPVQVSRKRVPTASARGVVVCSGNSNSCTGEPGVRDAVRMAAVAAESIDCPADQMLVCSTGIIGHPLPMAVIESGIRKLAGELHEDVKSLDAAAHAIITTDTHIKVATKAVNIDGNEIRLTGLCKGAAMIGPNMATMLAFVMTDAKVEHVALQRILRQAADKTFNCVSVEGHTSTCDSLLLFANGAAGGGPLNGPALESYAAAVTEICETLARAIADDAEGISHLITIQVEGTRNDAEARRIAKTVAESALVKTAIFGADPNWGRIVSAAGYSGVEFAEKDLSLWLGDAILYDKGTPLPFDEKAASAYIKNHREIDMRLVFTLGSGKCRFWTCDMGYEYIRLNAEYTT